MSYIINRPKPIVYSYSGKRLIECSNATNVQQEEYFGQIGTLDFTVPRYEYDSKGELVYDSNGLPNTNPALEFLLNENIVDYGDKIYVIKEVIDIREQDNKKSKQVLCKDIGIEFSRRLIESKLSFKPPQGYIADVSRVISEIISHDSQKYNGYVVSSTLSTITLNTDASSVDDYYNGCKIVVLDGTGEYQFRDILDYNGTTKVLTLSSNLSTILDTTSLIRIYNFDWELGYVDPSLASGSQSYEFEDVSMLDALYTTQGVKGGYLTFTASRSYELNQLSKLTKKVNLLLPNSYSNFEVRYEKNLKSISKRMNSDNTIYTRILPQGNDNLTINLIATEQRTDSGVTYDAHTYGQPYIYNYSYPLSLGYTLAECEKYFLNTYNLEDDVYVDSQDLYDDAKDMLDNELSQPKITYTVDFYDLSVIPDGEYSHEVFNVGDTIRVVDTELGITVETTLVKKDVNHDNPYDVVIELANYNDTYTDFVNKLIQKNNDFANKVSISGKSVTKILGVKGSSTNYKTADYYIEEGAENAQDLINRIIDIDFAKNGGKLVLLDGEYKLNGAITSTNANLNITIEGQEYDTFINQTVATRKTIDFPSASNITLKNFRTNAEIDLASIDNLTILNIQSNDILSSTQKAFEISNSNNVKIDSCIGNNIGNTGIDLTTSPKCIVSNCSYSDAVNGIVLNRCEGSSIYGNNLVSCSENGIRIEGNSRDTKVSLNYIQNSGKEGLSIVTLGTNNTENLQVSGNIISYSGRDGIYMRGAGTLYPVEGVIINANNVYGSSQEVSNTYDNIKIEDWSNNISIQNNICEAGDATNKPRYGVCLEAVNFGAEPQNTLVSNNDLKDSGFSSSFNDAGIGTITLGGNRL